ncbi:MAG: divalent-cation tolerance protein CutA [Acidobacteria bacterium]|nr:divalent-cation tolerance protein CutA [Acidobacteriota bacterium]
MTDKIVVLCTCGSAGEAERVSSALVESRAAACVNIVPGLTSVYRWQGAVERASEWLLVIKSRRELFPKIRAEIERLHSYETPEIVALPVVDGAEAYLGWLDRETRSE